MVPLEGAALVGSRGGDKGARVGDDRDGDGDRVATPGRTDGPLAVFWPLVLLNLGTGADLRRGARSEDHGESWRLWRLQQAGGIG